MGFIYYFFVLIAFGFVYADPPELGLKRGEICKPGRRIFKCEYLKDCPHIGDFNRKRQKICSHDGTEPIVCCPSATSSTSSQNTTPANLVQSNGNARKACEKYLSNVCSSMTNNGQLLSVRTARALLRPSVVGGKSSLPRVHVYMVLIGYGEENNKNWNCGGTLISENWVLSAAHCANPKRQGPARWARLGDLDLSKTTDDAKPQDKSIIERIVHPNYREPEVYNDIALFKLDSVVIINNWVAPICLNTEEIISASQGTVTGWGRLDFVGPVSTDLQEVNITLVSGTECSQIYQSNSDSSLPRGIDTLAMICAGEKEGGKDACSGDSGGPLSINEINRCLKTQIGITSFGNGCGLPNTPGVYTRVSYYIPWIESVVWPTTQI